MKKPSLIALTTLFLGGHLSSFKSFNIGVQSVKLIEQFDDQYDQQSVSMLQLNSQEKNHCPPPGDDGPDDCGCDDPPNDDNCCCKKQNCCTQNPCEKAVDLIHGVDKDVEIIKENVKDIKKEQKDQGKDIDKILVIVKESQKDLSSIENTLASKNFTNGSLVNINIGCGCGCKNGNNSNNDTPGTLPNDTQTNCTDPNNVLADGKSYEFFQYTLINKKHAKFYLGSSSLNSQIPLLPKFADKYFGYPKTNLLNFYGGAFYIQRTCHVPITTNITQWRYSKSVALNQSLGGGQLIDAFGECLGYTGLNNFQVNGVNQTRLQWVPCITEAQIAAGNQTKENLIQQLWSGEYSSSSISKILLRNICSDQVAKRIPGSCSHEPIYKGAKCGTKWFEVSLVNQSDCIDGGIYNVDSCLNDFKSIVIA